ASHQAHTTENNMTYDPATESDSRHNPGRRRALQGGVALGAAAALPFWSQFALAQGEELVPFSDMPEGFVAPPVAPGAVHYLDTRGIDTFYTHNDDFYIVQHYNQPEVDARAFRLKVTGLVQRELSLDMAQLRARPRIEIDAGFECGGNTERLFQGLIGNARWAGCSLKALLQEAGIRPEGIEVVFYGLDKGTESVRDRN